MMNGKTPKKICVIGAGASGLITLKECLEEGHEVHCFESSI
jgi:cation diffusion facilitator CzcD-associated flavoprotein CzcO